METHASIERETPKALRKTRPSKIEGEIAWLAADVFEEKLEQEDLQRYVVGKSWLPKPEKPV